MNAFSDYPPALQNRLFPDIPRTLKTCEYRILEMPTSSLLIDLGQYNQHIFQLLDEFQFLPENWDGDDALPPSADGIMNARRLTTALNFKRTNAYHTAPGPNGEIMISLRSRDKQRHLEFILYPSKTIFVKLPSNGQPEQGILEEAQLDGLLSWLNRNA
jgi:hypothetical protein